MRRYLVPAGFLGLLLAAGNVAGLDFGSVAAPSAILYDAPSLKAKKLYVVSRYTPLELVVSLSDWVKVRNQDGSLGWVERRALGSTRYVVVTAALADVRQKPDPSAALAFQVRKQVALELVANTGAGWLRVRHPDGATGYIRAIDTWGD